MSVVHRRNVAVAAAAVLVLWLLAALGPAPPLARAAGPGPRDQRGYWLVAADGGVFAFGPAPFAGSAGGVRLNRPVAGGAPSRTGKGYWLVATDGGVFSYGDAGYFGSTGGIALNRPIVAMAPSLSGRGYWLVASDGGVFAFGDAGYLGSTGGTPLNRPIVAAMATPSGRGYWLVASDGGVFSFGDATFFGSTGSIHLNRPIVAAAPTPSGRGYWLVASDGGVFTFGDAGFYGSTGGQPLNRPVVSVATTPSGRGYWLVASDGGVFTFGDAPFLGSTGTVALASPIVGVVGQPPRPGTEVVAFYYPWWANTTVDGFWRHWDQGGHSPPDDVGADFYPSRGAYSSRDPSVVGAQMAEIAAAGIDTVAVSWWGKDSYEDLALQTVLEQARPRGVRVAVHLEPYAGRSIVTVNQDLNYFRSFGVDDVYVYEAQRIPASDWAPVNASAAGFRLFAETGNPPAVRSGSFAAWAAAARFTGIYTYDAVRYASSDFAGVCGGARMRLLQCAPSVAPGFTGQRATAIRSVRGRGGGATYDGQWEGAIDAAPDIVTITSYNEWHEGTQIEPSAPFCTNAIGCPYQTYEGAYGLSGGAAQTAYLDRTAMWADRLRAL